LRKPLYTIGVINEVGGGYIPERYNMPRRELVLHMRQLQKRGYPCFRIHQGDHIFSDCRVLIERTDGEAPSTIISRWQRWGE